MVPLQGLVHRNSIIHYNVMSVGWCYWHFYSHGLFWWSNHAFHISINTGSLLIISGYSLLLSWLIQSGQPLLPSLTVRWPSLVTHFYHHWLSTGLLFLASSTITDCTATVPVLSPSSTITDCPFVQSDHPLPVQIIHCWFPFTFHLKPIKYIMRYYYFYLRI